MNAKTKREIKKLAAQFHALRTPTPEQPIAALDHEPYNHLHESPDAQAQPSDPMMTFCPMCNQHMIMNKIMALVEDDA